MPHDFFNNATATVTRSQGERTARGFEETGTTTILESRGDLQESGRTLERKQDIHEVGDALFYADNGVSSVEPGDDIEIDHDDDRTMTGSVEEVIKLDSALLIGLDS